MMGIFNPQTDDELSVLDGPVPPGLVPPEPKNPSIFPAVMFDSRDRRGPTVEVGGGLHLRDHIAVQVVAGLAAADRHAGTLHTSFTARQLSEEAYRIADAMLAVRRGEAAAEARGGRRGG